jgi:hypothetical protein
MAMIFNATNTLIMNIYNNPSTPYDAFDSFIPGSFMVGDVATNNPPYGQYCYFDGTLKIQFKQIPGEAWTPMPGMKYRVFNWHPSYPCAGTFARVNSTGLVATLGVKVVYEDPADSTEVGVWVIICTKATDAQCGTVGPRGSAVTPANLDPLLIPHLLGNIPPPTPAPMAPPVAAPKAAPVAAPVTISAPKAAPVAVTAPKAAPVAVAAPKAAPVAVATPIAAPVSVTAPKAAPVTVTAPKAAPVAAAAPKAAPVSVAAPADVPVDSPVPMGDSAPTSDATPVMAPETAPEGSPTPAADAKPQGAVSPAGGAGGNSPTTGNNGQAPQSNEPKSTNEISSSARTALSYATFIASAVAFIVL